MNKANKIHYSSEEKMDIMREHLYGTSDVDHPEFTGKYDYETCQIAALIDAMPFRDLADLARALKIIAKGKPAS